MSKACGSEITGKSRFIPKSPCAPNKFERLLNFESVCKSFECGLQKLGTQVENTRTEFSIFKENTKPQNKVMTHFKSPVENFKRNMKFKYSNGAVSTACDTQAFQTEKQINVKIHHRNFPKTKKNISRISKSIAVDEIDEFRKLPQIS